MMAVVDRSASAWTKRLEEGRAAFNRGEFFDAHERWEEVWRDLAGAERVFVQGLIQIAAGLHHFQQRRPRPAARLLGKGAMKVAQGAPPSLDGFRLDALAGDVTRLLMALEAPGTPPPDVAAALAAIRL